MPDYPDIPFGEFEFWKSEAMKKMSINGSKEKGLPPNTTMREFTASRSTIPLFTSARVWICWNAWRSTTQPLKTKKSGNTESWRKRSAKAIPSILMCFTMQRRGIILLSKRKSGKKRASTYGRTNPFWTHRYPRRQTGGNLMCIPLTQGKYWTTYYKEQQTGAKNLPSVFLCFRQPPPPIVFSRFWKSEVKRGGKLFCCGLHLLQIGFHIEVERCACVCVS